MDFTCTLSVFLIKAWTSIFETHTDKYTHTHTLTHTHRVCGEGVGTSTDINNRHRQRINSALGPAGHCRGVSVLGVLAVMGVRERDREGERERKRERLRVEIR